MFSGAGSAERSSDGGLSCSPLEPWDGGGGYYHKDSGDKQRIRRGRDSEQASLHASSVIRIVLLVSEN